MPMVVQRGPDVATGPGRMMPPMAVSSMVMVMVAMVATVHMLPMVAMLSMVAVVAVLSMVAVVAVVAMMAMAFMAAIEEAEGMVEGLWMDGDWQIQAPLCCL